MSKQGKILLVGFGPGAEAHMTIRAREAIAEADVVIGYSTYIRLVRDLLDGKEVIRKGMTEEIDRCIEAYEQARQGKTVALVSSGDIGVYGMAGPTYEVLLQAGWRPGDGIEVEVVPGCTALSACASLVGAPLTHDFCSISLSDLLTPWPVIARRLEAAARSDFVIALYNPKSGRRTGQIVEAQRILLQYRRPDTPVAIVKSAYRDLQDIQMVTLERMAECKIGMLTTVLIGNSSTYLQENLMITPRGYANKYEGIGGQVQIREGEKAGRSLSMGLEGWKACVREYLDQHPDAELHAVARHFGITIGNVLAAIGEADAEAPTGGYAAVVATGEALNRLLDAAADWGPLCATISNDNGACSELRIDGNDLTLRDGQLLLQNDPIRLQVDWAQVDHAWLLGKDDHPRAVYFLDALMRPVFSLALIGEEGTKAFQATWNALTDATAMAVAG